MRQFRNTDSVAALPRGGDLRSHRIEALGSVILGAIEAEKDITLVELAALLLREHGASFAPSTVHRFLVRHRITLKKTRPAKLAGKLAVPAWPGRRPGCGGTGCAASVRAGADRGGGAVCSRPAVSSDTRNWSFRILGAGRTFASTVSRYARSPFLIRALPPPRCMRRENKVPAVLSSISLLQAGYGRGLHRECGRTQELDSGSVKNLGQPTSLSRGEQSG